jgi:hypothetical protein
MGCQNFKNYHDLYLTTDTLLLSDVFENFRDVSMTKLSPGSGSLFDHALANLGRMFKVYECRTGVDN